MAATPTGAVIQGPGAFQSQFGVSREIIKKLETYEVLLKRWQKTINLVAPSTLEAVWHRHFADSAQVWSMKPAFMPDRAPAGAGGGQHWLDLGSGAGFPGLVLAILGSEGGQTRHTLIESDSRKAAFLREVARETGVAVDILCTRIESAKNHAKVGQVDCVTARALAPLANLLELAGPYFASPTVGLFLKGRGVTAELEDAVRGWKFDHQLFESITDSNGRVLLLKELKAKTEG